METCEKHIFIFRIIYVVRRPELLQVILQFDNQKL